MDISWDALSEAEQRLVEATVRGDIAELAARNSAEKPKVRAHLIRALLLGLPSGQDRDAPYAVQHAGVRVRGAHIVGDLDLRACRGVGEVGLPGLGLFDCDAPGRIDLRQARIARLSVERSRVGQILCISAHIAGPFNFSEVSPFDPDGVGAWINAAGAVIEGEVIGFGAKLVTPKRSPEVSPPWSRWYALRLSDARIEGGINLGSGFEADGGVTISAAHIGGDVQLLHARLIAGESRALNARSSRITGMVMMIDGCWASGEVSFADAIVQGRLTCSEGGRVRNAAEAEIAAGRKVRAFLRVDGTLDMRGAEFSAVELGGGFFNNGGGWAINAAGVRVRGDFRLRPDGEHRNEPTYVRGGLRLEGAQIGGEVMWLNLALEGPGPPQVAHAKVGRDKRRERLAVDAAKAPRIMMADAHIGRALKACALEILNCDPKSRVHAVIDLTGVRCSALDDDLENSGWGQDKAKVWLMLEGFIYGRLEEDVKFQGPRSSKSDRWRKRRVWLKRKFEAFDAFHPQPYYQLADFYARSGWVTDMHMCLEHEQWLHLRHEAGGRMRAIFLRPLTTLFGMTAGFGHNAMRLWMTLGLYLAIGALGADLLNRTGRLVVDVSYVAEDATPDTRAMSADSAAPVRCGGEIDPIIYALDVMIPLIDLRQELQCEPGFADASYHGSELELFLLRLGKALYALFGAVLTGATVLTLTGVLRRRIER